MECPYCGGETNKLPEFARLSYKRQAILRSLLRAGQAGVSLREIRENFFPHHSETTIRTTIHYINKQIFPLKIDLHGKTLRLVKSYKPVP